MATVKLSPLLRWVKLARPAAGEVGVHPAIGFPAPARKLGAPAKPAARSDADLESDDD